MQAAALALQQGRTPAAADSVASSAAASAKLLGQSRIKLIIKLIVVFNNGREAVLVSALYLLLQ